MYAVIYSFAPGQHENQPREPPLRAAAHLEVADILVARVLEAERRLERTRLEAELGARVRVDSAPALAKHNKLLICAGKPHRHRRKWISGLLAPCYWKPRFANSRYKCRAASRLQTSDHTDRLQTTQKLESSGKIVVCYLWAPRPPPLATIQCRTLRGDIPHEAKRLPKSLLIRSPTRTVRACDDNINPIEVHMVHDSYYIYKCDTHECIV
eukprot:1183751-Prorocentrum_minimum.AAC.1